MEIKATFGQVNLLFMLWGDEKQGEWLFLKSITQMECLFLKKQYISSKCKEYSLAIMLDPN